MKRFIIINLLAAMVLPMLACAGGWTTNFYLFRIYDSQEFSDRVQTICRDNWKAYLCKWTVITLHQSQKYYRRQHWQMNVMLECSRDVKILQQLPILQHQN